MSQREIWENEHRHSTVLPKMNEREAASGVKAFWAWVCERHYPRQTGLELGCGKGRNSIWLSGQGAEMTAFDFSENAVGEARKRALEQNAKVSFLVHDATRPWPFASQSFDFGIDCFASTDIDSSSGRAFARDEFKRVLKAGGLVRVHSFN